MKKILFFMICCVGFFVLFSHYEELLGSLQWLEKPRVHVVQKGESLSRLAQKNYGSVNYWRELALVSGREWHNPVGGRFGGGLTGCLAREEGRRQRHRNG